MNGDLLLTITHDGDELWLEKPSPYAPNGAICQITIGCGQPDQESGAIYLDDAAADELIKVLQRCLTWAPEDPNPLTKIKKINQDQCDKAKRVTA